MQNRGSLQFAMGKRKTSNPKTRARTRESDWDELYDIMKKSLLLAEYCTWSERQFRNIQDFSFMDDPACLISNKQHLTYI